MHAAIAILAVFVASILLFGAKLAALFGIVVSCATYHFPLGLIGLIGTGAVLTVLLGAHAPHGASPSGTD